MAKTKLAFGCEHSRPPRVPSRKRSTMSATSSTHSQTEQSGAEQIAVLMDQMRSKEKLVLQLTERLEQAAEQLDRMQRSGGDRRAPGGGGGSRELVEQTGQLTSRVEEALELWGQSSSYYEAIMQRLDEIAGGLSQATVVESKPGSKPAGGLFQAPASAASTAKSTSPSGADAGPGQGSFWEKMKASMADGSTPPSPPSSHAGASSSQASTSGGGSSPTQSSETVAIEEIAPPPVVIDVDTASIGELREAVATRDAYISTLITELRSAHTLPPLPKDLMNSGLGPEDLLANLVELEQRLTTGVQRENLELALERARMGRERARMNQVKTQLEEHIKHMAAPVVKKPEEAPPEDAGGKNMGWLKRVTGQKK